MSTFYNLKSPKWTAEEKEILNAETSKAPISPDMLDRLQKKLPGRTRSAIASAIKRYVVKAPPPPPVEEPLEISEEAMALLRILITLRIADPDYIIDLFGIEDRKDKIKLKAATAVDEIKKLIKDKHTNVEYIAFKYNRTVEQVKASIDG